jgi:tRNA pseudouridine13 synthase
LYLEKKQHNTHWVAAELARYAGINERDIGVCGRKDRHAITRQWFSLYDPDRKPVDWQQFVMDGVKILKIERHSKKLRLGDHQYNHFDIRLRQVRELSPAIPAAPLADNTKQQLVQSITDKLTSGVPNYFGAQRFGREGGNLRMANDWLVNGFPPPKKQRSMVLSAARAYLFNVVLAYRVRNNNWQQALEGDVQHDSHPTGPLWGRGRLASAGAALAIEQNTLEPYQQWCERLEHQGLQQQRRELALLPKNFSCCWQEDDLLLSFDLPVGTFATSLLAEVAILDNQAPTRS